MKRFLSLFLTLILLLSFTGCDNPDEEFKGQFYTLKEAYEMGLLTHDDLVQIADYHHHNVKNEESIDAQTEYKLRVAWANTLTERGTYNYCFPNGLTVEDVVRLRYYGVYNGAVVVLFFPALQSDGWTGSMNVGDVTFFLGTRLYEENFVVWVAD